MSIRTTVTFDEDVLERVKRESRARGTSFKETLNDLLRTALTAKKPGRRQFPAGGRDLGIIPGLNYDKIEELLELAEGPLHR